MDEIRDNSRLIYKLANNISYKDREDLYQVGIIGLINAYNNYDKCYNTKFSTYAYPYILGEMKKYIRENNGIKISKELIYLSSRLDRLILLLTQKYKKTPTIEDLEKETGIEKNKIVEALNIRDCIKSLDDTISDEMTILDTVKVYDKDNTVLSSALEMLDDEEKTYVKNRYFLDKTQDEMGIIMGYSQAKVSRYEKKVLTKLRNYYKD